MNRVVYNFYILLVEQGVDAVAQVLMLIVPLTEDGGNKRVL